MAVPGDVGRIVQVDKIAKKDLPERARHDNSQKKADQYRPFLSRRARLHGQLFRSPACFRAHEALLIAAPRGG